mmetsp:Transcript_91873/g.238048  ORF Transcript_91873/g.238048 Transcript_91873/m.238048 type:complete len:629 (-) Transcript_91873:1450-3336(-)
MPGAVCTICLLGMVVDVEQMDGVVDGQANHSDEEDALVLSETPADHRHEPEEDRGDAGDVHQPKASDPPVPCRNHHDDEGDQKGEHDTHDCSLDHLPLCHHEEVELRGLDAADVGSVLIMEGLPTIVPLVGILHAVLRRIRCVETHPREGQGVPAGAHLEASVVLLCLHAEAPARGLQQVAPRLHVGLELVAAEVLDEVAAREAGVVVLCLLRVAVSSVPDTRAGRASSLGSLADAILPLDPVSPIARKVLHEAIATAVARHLGRDVDACLLQHPLVGGTSALEPLAENEAGPRVAARRRFLVVAEVGGAAQPQELALALRRDQPRGRGCGEPRHVVVVGVPPLVDGILLIEAPGHGGRRDAEDLEVAEQDLEAADDVQTLAADGGRLLCGPQARTGARDHADDDDDPHDDAGDAEAVQTIEKLPLAEALKPAFVKLCAARLRELPDAGFLHHTAAPTAAPWSTALALLLTAEHGFDVNVVHSHGRAEEADAEEPIDQDDHGCENTKVADLRQRTGSADEEGAASCGCRDSHRPEGSAVGPSEAGLPVVRAIPAMGCLQPGVVEDKGVVSSDTEDHVDRQHLEEGDLLLQDDCPQRHGHWQGEDDLEHRHRGEEATLQGPPHVRPDED